MTIINSQLGLQLFTKLENLTQLNISFLSKITDAGVIPLARRCTEMTEFYAKRAKLTDASVLKMAKHWTNLKKLDISDSVVTQTGLSALVDADIKLTSLLVSVEGSDGAIIGKIKTLEELGIYNLPLGLLALKEITGGKKLIYAKLTFRM